MHNWPASNVQATAADAQPALPPRTPSRPGTHDLSVVGLGYEPTKAAVAGREGGAVGGTWLCGFHTNKLFSVEFEAVQYSSPHFATRLTLPSSPRPSEQRPVPPQRHVRRRCSVE
jgi:hypothetical protein